MDMQSSRIPKQGSNRFRKPDSFELRFFHHHRRSLARQRLSIHPLVVVRGPGKRNEDRGLSRRCNFRHGAGAGAADQQIRTRKCCRHILDKLKNLHRLP